MKLKLFCALLFALALTMGALCFAQSYGDASARINFYYQHDGGGRSELGTWDAMLRDRLLAVSGHSEIYHDSSTDRYLTGRGCCLFSFSHAYQYLLGYAPTAAKKADILYQFLSYKPVWSNTGSTLSPPNAHSYYAAYLAKQSGVSRYSGALDSFSALQSFFDGGRGVVIVHVPGHYIIAVGARRYNGVEYIQVVDSILSATVRSGRISYGKSKDFSVTYTPDNAAFYEAAVHDYWIPYSEVASKCKLPYAFRSGSTPPQNHFELTKIEIVLPEGQTTYITFRGTLDFLNFESLNPGICEVDALGRLIWVSEGTARIRVTAPDNPLNVVYANVYCIRPDPDAIAVAEASGPVSSPFTGLALPAGAKVVCAEAAPAQCGLYSASFGIVDPYGDTVATVETRLLAIDSQTLLDVPQGIRRIEAGAFADTRIDCVYLPSSVTLVESGAFAGTEIRLVLADCPVTALESGALPEGALLLTDTQAYRDWRSGR